LNEARAGYLPYEATGVRVAPRGGDRVRKMIAATTALQDDEFRKLVADRVRRFFGMTLDEFARAFRAGELDGRPIACDLALLVGVKGRAE